MHALIEALRDVLGLLRHVRIRLAVDKTLEVLFADVPNTMQVLSRTSVSQNTRSVISYLCLSLQMLSFQDLVSLTALADIMTQLWFWLASPILLMG